MSTLDLEQKALMPLFSTKDLVLIEALELDSSSEPYFDNLKACLI